jgi:hypothetical protein
MKKRTRPLTKAQRSLAALKRAKAEARDKRAWARVIKGAESILRSAGIKL